jgi:hypothetical protein
VPHTKHRDLGHKLAIHRKTCLKHKISFEVLTI